MTHDPDDVSVRHVPEQQRYELLEGDAVIGTAHYVPFDAGSGPQRIFFHTVIDDAYGGRGLGSKLVTVALDETAAAGIGVVPVCPYVEAFLRRHPELGAHAVAVEPEHLAAVEAR